MGSFSEWLFGSPDKYTKMDLGTQEQTGLHNDILARAMGMSQQGGGYDLANQYNNNLLGPNQQQAYDQFSQPYLQQFNEQILPGIAELFSQLQGQAAQQQYGQYNQLAQTGLNHQQFGYRHTPSSQGFLNNLAVGVGGQLASPLANGIAGGIGNLFKKPGAQGGGIT